MSNLSQLRRARVKAMFLAEYATNPVKTRASEAIGISVRTIERWEKDDPAFAERILEAKRPANDRVVATAYDLAVSGDDPHMTRWWLSRQKPEEFGDRPVDVNMRHSVDPELPAIMAKISGVTEDAGA